MKRFGGALILGVMILSVSAWGGSASAEDDWQYWSRATVDAWKRDRLSFSLYGDLRVMEDFGDTRLYLISERLSYKWLDNLSLGINHTYLDSKTRLSSGADEFKHQNRLELEVNPRWTLAGGVQIKNRNRVEFRWIEDQGADNTRFRQLWEAAFPLEGMGALKFFYMNAEYFYDFKSGRTAENRLIPAGIEFKISEQARLKVFYMIQSRRGAADWLSNQVIGTHVTVSF